MNQSPVNLVSQVNQTTGERKLRKILYEMQEDLTGLASKRLLIPKLKAL